MAVTGMESIAVMCFDYNPTMKDRPLRDGAWIRKQYGKMKTEISQCFINYHRSGYQDATNIYDEWIKFATLFNNDVIIYARALFNDTEMDQLGRALPSQLQRDTGGIPRDTEMQELMQERKRNAEARNRQRRQKKSKNSLTSPISESITDDSPSEVQVMKGSKILENGIGVNNRIAALKVLLEFGSEEQKSDALKEILILSKPSV
jgi:hypothetical protein